MSKEFRIAKRISMEDIDFEDVKVEDDFLDKDMAQIISDNEFDPLYDDSETIAVALQLAGYGKLADLKAKLAEKDEEIEELKEITSNVIVPRRLTKIEMSKLINQQTLTAIIELEKMKEFCDGMKWAMVHLTKENTQTIQTVLDEIDNQIKLLKEGK